MENVAVVGASKNEERYSYKAIKMLLDYGHNPTPVAPALTDVLGRPATASLNELRTPIDTVTLYVGPARQGAIVEDILSLKPRRVIFNPGTENPDAYPRIRDAGIEVVEGCTLVMLRTNQF